MYITCKNKTPPFSLISSVKLWLPLCLLCCSVFNANWHYLTEKSLSPTHERYPLFSPQTLKMEVLILTDVCYKILYLIRQICSEVSKNYHFLPWHFNFFQLLKKYTALDPPDHIYNWQLDFFTGREHCTQFVCVTSLLELISSSAIQRSTWALHSMPLLQQIWDPSLQIMSSWNLPMTPTLSCLQTYAIQLKQNSRTSTSGPPK